MSGTNILDTQPPPPPPWPNRAEGRLRFFKQLSDRTPLRTKLITAVLALVIMALAAISVASVVMLRIYVETRQDNTLRSEFSQYLNAPALSNGSANVPLTRGPGGFQPIQPGYAYSSNSEAIWALQVPGSQVSWYYNFTPPTGNSGGTTTSQAPLPLLPTSASWANSPGGVLLTVPARSGPDTWRVIAQTQTYPVTNNSTGQQTTEKLTLVAAIDLGNLGAMTSQLVIFDLIVGGAIVIVLAAVAIGVIRANLRPLDDIELTAGQIAKGHLNHRVPEGDPRTEIGSLGRSLNAMLAQIEAAFLAQEESERAAHQSEERMRRFIADASHELRTPLTTIRGFAAHYRQRGGAGGWLRGQGSESAAGGFGDEKQEPSSGAGQWFSATANGTPGGVAGGSASGAANGASGSPASAEAISPEDLDHLMARVESEATRMGVLVEDLLTLARLDQQRPLNIAPVDLLTLAADAVQDARIVAPDRQVSLSVEPGTAFLVDGDEARLRQVLGNLVNNALTHTPAGTPVRVKIGSGTLVRPRSGAGRAGGRDAEPGSRDAEPGGREQSVPAVVLDVEDDGPGMAAEQAQRVFERFYRADAARNRASGGTGLGLAIVNGLVTAHGGTVSVRTAPGTGADFQVRLPLSPDAQLDDSDDDLNE